MDAFYANSISVPGSQVVTGAQKHPGDYADAQSVLDWEKSTRAELKTSNFAEVLAGRVPAAIKRSTLSVPVDAVYPVLIGDDYTPMQKSARMCERAKHNHENDVKAIERESAMRSLNDRIYNTLYPAPVPSDAGHGARHAQAPRGRARGPG